MTATSSIFPKGSFDFALPHALSLAEAGTSVEDKRIGKSDVEYFSYKSHIH